MKTISTYLVEDSAVIRESLIATLEELSEVRVVGCAEDESSATHWLLATENHVDLVIIDLFLKSGTGLGVLNSVRGKMHDSTLVVLTNYATADMRHKCLTLGASRVFDKSHDVDALILYCNQLSDVAQGGSTARLLQ